jgi:Subtilase family/PA domain/Fibronectin type-III domain
VSRGNHRASPRRRRALKLCVLPVAIVLLSLVAGGVASGAKPKVTPHLHVTAGKLVSTYVAAKSESGHIARSDPSLIGRTDSTRVNVMIKYDFDASASYTGGVAGLPATSPRVTGKSLAQNAGAVQKYDKYTAGVTQKVSSAASKAAPGLKVGRSFGTVYGGVAASVPANQIGALLKTPGVVAVQKDALNKPLDDNTSFIGATNVWPSLGGAANAGSNVVFGDIDTGVWPENPMLSPTDESAPAGGLKGCQFGDGSDVAHLGPTFACNNKLIGAYAFTQTYMAVLGSNGQEFCNNTTGVCSPRDSEGHGTHTTTTAAGDCVSSAVLYGVERGPVCGIAPGAHVIEYRVCLSQGCFGADSVAAVEQAIADGVNVINFSISGGADPYTDPVELAFLDATNAGVSVNAAAGNSGPGSGTADHGGPWVTTVGALTGPRSFGSTLHLTADGGATLDVPGVTLTNGISSPTPVVLASSLPSETALCENTLAAGTATGKVVVCARGNNGRIDKGRRVLAGGAAGMILYNQSAAVTDLESDNHYLPAIQTQFNSNSIANFVSSHTNVMATWAQGAPQASQSDVMASFSSRGPLGDWVKPDVAAPGVQVLAGTTPQPDQTTADNGPPGNLFMAIAGTSMATPHSAGVSILVKAAHPTWTPEEIKSALMASSVQDVVKEDGTTPASVFDDGAGSIRADRAVNPTLVFDETYADFVDAGSDHLHRVDLNIASVDATTMTGDLTTQRTATNVSGKSQNMAVQISEPAGVTITVGNNNHDLHIAKDETLTFPIEISAPDVADGQYEGRIDLVPAKGGNTVTIPVAFVKTQGSVTLSNSCSPTSFAAKTGSSHCTVTATNLGSVAANASLTVKPRESGKPLQYKNVGAPASVIGSGEGVQWSGPLGPSLAPAVNGFTTGAGEPYGYVPLSALGVSPLPGTGDETISNESFNTFYYGGEPYDTVGAVSDGYAVVGGGDSNDINFVTQSFPNPSRPNNVVAPFWTDLNPSFGGNIYMAQVGDGVDDWVVVDFESVRNYDTADTHTFEIWFRNSGFGSGSGPGSEQVTVVYGANGVGDPDTVTEMGAENRDGSSGQNLGSYPGNGAQLTVDMGQPTPGGSVAIPFDVTGKKTGTYHSDAALTSDQTPGTTIAPQALTVTP